MFPASGLPQVALGQMLTYWIHWQISIRLTFRGIDVIVLGVDERKEVEP
jgi:hypothetical protein